MFALGSKAASAISPNISLTALLGILGKWNLLIARASAWENFLLDTGWSDTKFSGPTNLSSSSKCTRIFTVSLKDIQLSICLPEPMGPTQAIRKGNTKFFSTPPLGPSTNPKRGWMVRISASITFFVAASHFAASSARKSLPGGLFSSKTLVSSVP